MVNTVPLGNSTNTRWLRCSQDHFQPSNNDQALIVIDAQHARAITFGHQTASQFGFGTYDVEVELVPSFDAINPEDGRLAVCQVRAAWVEPTPLRMTALRNLKSLERLDDMIDPFVAPSGDNNTIRAANPLLAAGVAQDADTTNLAAEPKGSKIIRFGWSGGSSWPKVYAQSTFSNDLNADGDTGDTHESQSYVLVEDTSQEFGILPRQEQAVNPLKDGHRLVQHQWVNPTSSLKVNHTSYTQKQVVWALNVKPENTAGLNLPGGIHTVKANFRGIRALGGLIAITVPEMFTSAIGTAGTANNDYELNIHLRCRSWTPME